jgi:hypothetical protein
MIAYNDMEFTLRRYRAMEFYYRGAFWRTHDLRFEIPLLDCIGRDEILVSAFKPCVPWRFNRQEYGCNVGVAYEERVALRLDG